MTAAARGPRVALVHDWLTGMRGGEKVLEVARASCSRDADLFTLVHVPGSVSPGHRAARARARRSSRRLPGAGRIYRHLPAALPVRRRAVRPRRLRPGRQHQPLRGQVGRPARAGAAPLLLPHPDALRRGTSATPTSAPARLGRPARRLLRPVLAWLARWDAATAHRVDRYLANSQHVARRIRRYYNRRSAVVYPPVDTDFYRPDATVPTATALVVSALVPYKRIDLAIEACRLAGVPLRIVGQGPEESRLRADGGPGRRVPRARCSDEEIRDAATARPASSCCPGEEDFGIVPVEAQACGRPGGRARPRRRARDGRRRRDRRAGAVGRRPTRWRPASAGRSARRSTRRHPAARRAVRPRRASPQAFRALIDETMAAPAGEAAW